MKFYLGIIKNDGSNPFQRPDGTKRNANIITLPCNPNSFKYGISAMTSEDKVLGGHVIGWYGHNLRNVTITGSTGYLDGSKEITFSSLKILKEFAERPIRAGEWGVCWFENHVFIGYFKSFDFGRDINTPNNIPYTIVMGCVSVLFDGAGEIPLNPDLNM